MYVHLQKKQLELLTDEIIKNVEAFCIKWRKKKIVNPINMPILLDFFEELSVISCNPLIDLLYWLWFSMPFCSYYSVFTAAKWYTYRINDAITYVPQTLKEKILTQWQMPKRKYIWTYTTTIMRFIVLGNFKSFVSIYRQHIQDKLELLAKEKGMMLDKTNKTDNNFIDIYDDLVKKTIWKLLE